MRRCTTGKNLAYRAAKAFFAETGITGGAEILIEKHIPAEAGMGGGSSDAACVLHALNSIYAAGLSFDVLSKIGVKLGADIPFALHGGTCRAEGIGELLTPIKNNFPVHYLILKPRSGVPTGDAFRLADSMPQDVPESRILSCIRAVEKGDAELFAKTTFNALTAPALTLCPQIGETLAFLETAADCISAFMTGSGSACVGMFPDRAAAEAAAELAEKLFSEHQIILTKAH
ncbi:MAG: 4-(cytidine 5'-diphospho)-2-C-methyl-D-erythritol kinase [Christensenellaceae bacterium]|nr:4-(cytidine 5'-diphospho)-2-C-methyl-D-erythritol kinase [Christensenellaceae bacterium]